MSEALAPTKRKRASVTQCLSHSSTEEEDGDKDAEDVFEQSGGETTAQSNRPLDGVQHQALLRGVAPAGAKIWRHDLGDGCVVELIEGLWSKQERMTVIRELAALKTPAPIKLRVYNKDHWSPRDVAGFGDEDLIYSFSGTNVPAEPWSAAPCLLDVRTRVAPLAGVTPEFLNFALFNHYATGQNYIGFHRDDEKVMKDWPNIVSVTFGAARLFVLQHMRDTKRQLRLVLNSGAVLLMHDPVNKYWKHSVPKTATVQSSRWNITFRHFNVHMAAKPPVAAVATQPAADCGT